MAFGFGMPAGFDSLIAAKYAILQQHADAASTEANANALLTRANANLTDVKAGLLPTESAADVAKTQAETAGQNITNRFLPFTLGGDALDRLGSARLSNANANLVDVNTTAAKRSLMPASSLFSGGFGGGFGSYGGFGLSL